MEIEENIVDCFKLGVGATKPIVIQVESIVDRAVIIQAMDTHRKECAELDIEQKVYVSDYLPAEMKEQRGRERDIYKANEKEVVNQIPMQFERGALKVQGQKYHQMISPPDPTKVLQYTDEQLDAIYNLKFTEGGKVSHEGTSYLAFVIPVNSHIAIEQAYMRLRLRFPTAKHLMLGYSIPGMPRFKYEEFCDDGEIGAGRIILSIIKKNQLTNIAIFVARIQHGGNIGPVRFNLIKQLVDKAMEKKPFNKFINARQVLKQNSTSGFDNPIRGHSTMGRRPGKAAPWRGGHRGNQRGNQLQPPPTDGQYKRRRKNSSNDYEFEFNPPAFPGSFSDALSMNMAPKKVGVDLGSSWPSLQQSATL